MVTFYFAMCSMNYSLAVQTTVRQSVSPGIEHGLFHIRDDKQYFAIKIMRPIFEEISLFHKKNTKQTYSSNADLFALRRSNQPLSYCT